MIHSVQSLRNCTFQNVLNPSLYTLSVNVGGEFCVFLFRPQHDALSSLSIQVFNGNNMCYTFLDSSLACFIKSMLSVSQPRLGPDHHGDLQLVGTLPLGKH